MKTYKINFLGSDDTISKGLSLEKATNLVKLMRKEDYYSYQAYGFRVSLPNPYEIIEEVAA